ncbi:MAG: hypothetical protein GY722_11320, partial [bacterium]|nr:hypothetical protein [bacterium]
LPPTSVSAEDEVAEARVLVTWACASQAETGYNIYRALADAPVDTALIGSVDVNNAAYIDLTGASDVEYTYFVATHDDLGESTRDSDNGIRRLFPPGNMSATDGAYEDQVVITWVDDSGTDNGFRIYRDDIPIGIVDEGTTTFTDDTTDIGSVYSYSVRTSDPYGSSLPATDSGSAALLAPTSLSASTEYTDRIRLVWIDDSEVNDSYVVYRDGVDISGVLDGYTNVYNDTAVPAADTEYEYCVVAGLNGTETTPVCATGMKPSAVSAGTNTAGFITDLTASDLIYDNRVRLEWTDAGALEDGFRVYRDDLLIETLDAGSQSYNDFDAAPGSVHVYRVEGFNSSLSGWETDMGWRPADGGIAGRVTTLSGAPVDGVDIGLDPTPNQALIFDGLSARVYNTTPVPTEFAIGGEFTVEWWMKIGDFYTHAAISYRTAGDWEEFAMSVDQVTANDLRIRWHLNAYSGQSALINKDITDNEWHHYAVSYTSQQMRFYVDGAYHGYTSIPQGSLESGGKFMLGQLQSTATEGNWDANYSLEGMLDEVKIWDSVLDQPTISANRFNKLSGSEVGLLHYWPLDAGSGNGAADLTGHGGDGYVYVPGWTGDGAPVTSTAQTDLDGNYSMSGIRYGESTTFAVMPSATNRTFDPTYTNITLDENSPIQ